MKKSYFILIALILIGKISHAQVITGSSGQIEIPNVTSNAGPLGSGSLLYFLSGDANTVIQENWGLNLGGDALRPVKIPFSSLLIGYTSGNVNYGSGNAYISGVMGIGTTSVAPGYIFGVNGNMVANGITVKMYPWSDYVFKSSYRLTPLSELKTYVDLNHHLPEIPSEKEIATNGLNLGDIDRLLTKKVEELTLYLIEKDKQLNEEKETNSVQQRQIDTLKQQLELANEQLKAEDERMKKIEDAMNKLSQSK